ncbi:MAG: hypothetical protein WKF34_06930 [Pyrinomonadaceae bacterium]
MAFLGREAIGLGQQMFDICVSLGKIGTGLVEMQFEPFVIGVK